MSRVLRPDEEWDLAVATVIRRHHIRRRIAGATLGAVLGITFTTTVIGAAFVPAGIALIGTAVAAVGAAVAYVYRRHRLTRVFLLPLVVLATGLSPVALRALTSWPDPALVAITTSWVAIGLATALVRRHHTRRLTAARGFASHPKHPAHRRTP